MPPKVNQTSLLPTPLRNWLKNSNNALSLQDILLKAFEELTEEGNGTEEGIKGVMDALVEDTIATVMIEAKKRIWEEINQRVTTINQRQHDSLNGMDYSDLLKVLEILENPALY